MVKGTRIRWVNVARLAAGVIGCVALVLGLPALLERPEPPPLPADVGLSPATMPPSGQLRAARSLPKRDEDARGSKEHGGERKARARRHHARRPSRRRQAGPDPAPKPPSEPEPLPDAAPAPAPAPAATPPAPEPAYVPPPAAPPPSPPPPPAPQPQPTSPPPSSGGPEFGFEH